MWLICDFAKTMKSIISELEVVLVPAPLQRFVVLLDFINAFMRSYIRSCGLVRT